jgi:polyhydroxyalkanoate synthesis regulator phasin
MVDKPNSSAAQSNTATPGTPKPGTPSARRGTDMRDTVAELAERAQLISQEAGTKVAAAMKDVISAGAGIAGFAIESARDLVNYMVKRGQMTQEEGDSLIRDAEAAHERRPASEKSRPTATKIAAEKAAAQKAEAAARAAAAAAAAPPFRGARPVVPPVGTDNGSKPKPAAKMTAPAATSSPHATKSASPTAKKAAAKAASKNTPKSAKPTSKSAAKSPVKAAKTAKPAAKRGKK